MTKHTDLKAQQGSSEQSVQKQTLVVDDFDAGAAHHQGYREALQHLYGRLDTERLDPRAFATVDRDLSVYRRFLGALNNPHLSVPVVHVTGTRGKGSTVAMLESILKHSGMKTGATVSPHLVEVRERVRINGDDLPRDTFSEYYNSIIKPVVDDYCNGNCFRTVFEILTAMAFVTFREQQVNMAVVEVGMGGRLDATNVVLPELSIITRIGLDHTHVLGNSTAEIAEDKGQIIKENAPCIISAQTEEARNVLLKRAEDMHSEAWCLGRDFSYTIHKMSEHGTEITVQTPLRTHKYVRTPLIGQHQAENGAVAIAAADRLTMDGKASLSPDDISIGISETVWAGRGEILQHNPILMVDGAHTPQGIEALSNMVCSVWPETPVTLILGINKDKDADGILHQFKFKPEFVVATAAPTPRALQAEQLAAMIEENGWKTTAASIDNAIDTAFRHTPANGIIIATGSLYIVGAIRRRYLHR